MARVPCSPWTAPKQMVPRLPRTTPIRKPMTNGFRPNTGRMLRVHSQKDAWRSCHPIDLSFNDIIDLHLKSTAFNASLLQGWRFLFPTTKECSMDFKKNDWVVHCTHGLGQIMDIEKRT